MARPQRSDAITLALLLTATTLSTLGDGSIQVLTAPLFERQGLARSTIGVVVGAYSVSALVFRLTGGGLVQGLRARILVPLGSLMSATSFVLLPSFQRPAILGLLMALNGLGFALVSTGGLVAIMAARADDDSGSLMSWYTAFISLGYSLAGFTGGFVADRIGLAAGVQWLGVIPLATSLVLGAALWRMPQHVLTPPTPRRTQRPQRIGLPRVAPLVWLAFFVTVHINLIAGVLATFFPLYGIALGLSLTRIGALQGFHSGAASVVRLFTPLLFRVARPRPIQPWMVVIGGFAVAALALFVDYRLLLASWVTIGLTRGVLRVSSSALMMDATAGEDRGVASGVYLAGLDVGKIVGPLAGGIAVQFLGFRWTFLVAGLVIPLVFLVMDRTLSSLDLRRRAQGSDQE